MAELKSLSLQLQQTCSTPCTDTVQVQTITGTGRKKDDNEQMIKAQAVCITQEVSQPCPIRVEFKNICPCSLFGLTKIDLVQSKHLLDLC